MIARMVGGDPAPVNASRSSPTNGPGPLPALFSEANRRRGLTDAVWLIDAAWTDLTGSPGGLC
jgi:hypothetical protein